MTNNLPPIPMRDRRQLALDALDRLLGCQDCTKGAKADALQEVADAATRMAEGIRRHLKRDE